MQRILEESETLNTSVGVLIRVQQVPFFLLCFILFSFIQDKLNNYFIGFRISSYLFFVWL